MGKLPENIPEYATRLHQKFNEKRKQQNEGVYRCDWL